MHERVGGGSIQARLLLLHRSSNLPKYGMLTVKRKKKEKNHKKGIVSWLIKKKNLGKKWKIIYFFLNYALSWFKSSFNFQASYRMYQIDSFTIILELRIYEFFNHLTLFTCNLFVTCFHEFRICKTTNFFQEIFLILF